MYILCSLAEEYLDEVLLPEAMASIFQTYTNTTYELADKECRECEDTSAKIARLQGISVSMYHMPGLHVQSMP